jgi:hypothetical protein
MVFHSLCLPAIAYWERCIDILGFWRAFKNHKPEVRKQALNHLGCRPTAKTAHLG